ncbi:pyridoxamine 5'-phosphate oxidase family protein [Phreatobacter stygius]|uniref:pyridoxamine 5'-phosphate oxidase family protein n=1 Tax=Phreatobacter stygius TaxID=1940610 RepID=UPI001476A3BD|nr:pyridoxamine 5'-phosphate oxidase family protein [Phreatobacter stygius]
MTISACRDDLAASCAEAWRLIAAGVEAVRAPFHTPTIATVDAEGRPRLRTVVLRGCAPQARRIRFHTDIRSAKSGELARDPRIAVHFYDPGLKVQVQLAGTAEIAGADGAGQEAWDSARLGSRACYAVEPGPGSPIAAGGAYGMPKDAAGILAGVVHFAAITVTADRLEWLLLDDAGHRRAVFDWTGTGWDGRWLVP